MLVPLFEPSAFELNEAETYAATPPCFLFTTILQIKGSGSSRIWSSPAFCLLDQADSILVEATSDGGM